jgi:hypothetical protein
MKRVLVAGGLVAAFAAGLVGFAVKGAVPTITLESQAWWSKAGISIPSTVGQHIHVKAMVPVSTLGGRYLNRHRSQYDAGASTTTPLGLHVDRGRERRRCRVGRPRRSDARPGPRPRRARARRRTRDARLVDHDAVLAAQRLGVPLENRSGRGWAAVVAPGTPGCTCPPGRQRPVRRTRPARATSTATTHRRHPAFRIVDGRRQRWINDSICPTGRWEFESVLRAYAVKYSATVKFGVFTTPVPKVAAPKPVVTVSRSPADRVQPAVREADPRRAGQKANVRAPDPTSALAGIPNRLAERDALHDLPASPGPVSCSPGRAPGTATGRAPAGSTPARSEEDR